MVKSYLTTRSNLLDFYERTDGKQPSVRLFAPSRIIKGFCTSFFACALDINDIYLYNKKVTILKIKNPDREA